MATASASSGAPPASSASNRARVRARRRGLAVRSGVGMLGSFSMNANTSISRGSGGRHSASWRRYHEAMLDIYYGAARMGYRPRRPTVRAALIHGRWE